MTDVIDHLFALLVASSAAERRNLRSIYLAQFGDRIVPYCFRYFAQEKRSEVRSDLLGFMLPYARSRPDVVDFAAVALKDRSAVVRQSACALLACSLDERARAPLTELVAGGKAPTARHASNALAALDARDHNLFYPEYGTWVISADDRAQPRAEHVAHFIEKLAPHLVDPLRRILGDIHAKWVKEQT